MKILVTGASGFVGQQMCQRLLRNSHEVIALSRSGKAVAGAQGVSIDLTKETIEPHLRGVEAVIHLVGIINQQPSQGITFEHIHVDITRNLIAALENSSVERYLHMSALGSALDSQSGYSHSKAQAETLVRQSSLAWTIYQPSLIFGEEDEFFNGVLKDLVTQTPVIPQVGDGSFLFRPIWVGDVVEMFARSLELPHTIHQSYPLVGPKVYPFKALLQLMKETLGVHKMIVPVPLSLMSSMLPMMELLPKPPITRDQFLMLIAGNTAEADDMLKAFALKLSDLKELESYLRHESSLNKPKS